MTDGGCVPCQTCGGSQSRGWHLHDRQPDLAARIAQLEADLAAAEAKLAAVELLLAKYAGRSSWVGYEKPRREAWAEIEMDLRAALATQPAREVRHDRQCAAGITNGAARCQCATPPQPAP